MSTAEMTQTVAVADDTSRRGEQDTTSNRRDVRAWVQRHRRVGRALSAASLLVFPVGCGLASIAIGQDLTGDTLLYHDYDAWAFLHGGRLLTDVFAAQYQTLLSPFLDIPVYLAQTHLAPTTASFVVGMWQGLAPLLVVLIARRVIGSRALAWLAGVTAAVAGGFASELGSMMGDSTVAPFFVLATLLAVLAIERRAPAIAGLGVTSVHRGLHWPTPPSWLWFGAGLSAGVGAGLKFAETSSAVAGVVAILVIGGGWRRITQALSWSCVGLVLGALASAGYWSWFLWRHFGDPFAFTGNPLFFFNSPYFSSQAASAPWHAPSNLVELVFYPVYWFFDSTSIVGITLREASLPIAYLLVLALGLVTLLKMMTWGVRSVRHEPARTKASPVLDLRLDSTAAVDRYLVASLVVTLVIWVKVFGTYRYLIPLELLSPVIIVSVGRRIAAGLLSLRPQLRISKRMLVGTFAAACVVCLASETPGSYWQRIPFGASEYKVATPSMLLNGKLDVLVEEGANPDGFVLTLLKGKFVAIGGTGRGGATPAPIMKMQLRAFAASRRSGGTVIGFWTTAPPIGSQTAYIASLGEPGLRQGPCVTEHLDIGFGFEPVGFCEYLPTGKDSSTAST